MVVHELATNAAKYGALSTPHGRVEVRWSIDRTLASPESPGVARLTWAESGGPRVTPPARPGFGSKLIERSTSELDGTAQLDFMPAGLRYCLTLPLSTANSLPP